MSNEYNEDKEAILAEVRDIELAINKHPRDLIDAKNILYFALKRCEAIRNIFDMREKEFDKEIHEQFKLTM